MFVQQIIMISCSQLNLRYLTCYPYIWSWWWLRLSVSLPISNVITWVVAVVIVW